MRTVHPELRAVFDEHANPSHTSKRAVHAQLAPMVKVASDAQQQVHHFIALLDQAYLAEHNPELDSQIERCRVLAAEALHAAAAFSGGAKGLAGIFTQLDRYMAEWAEDLKAWKILGRVPRTRQAVRAAIAGQPIPPDRAAPHLTA